jgi:adenine-specific DNA-methyltransferase
VIKYIGSKRTLVPLILEVVRRIPGVHTACDIFTGTTRVAQALKAEGITVTANDLSSYATTLARCYIEADGSAIDLEHIEELIRGLEQLPDRDGYVTSMFCREARYFQPHNGMRIDAIRDGIDRMACTPIERSILLTSLIEAADRVDSTTGVQMAYLKKWSARSHNRLSMRVPELLAGSGTATQGDANELAKTMAPVDLCYLDPPYNQHSYHSNYHVWETIVRGDKPESYGIARKRIDCREVKSDYNSKRRALAAFSDLIASVPARHLLVSFNNEGFIRPDAMTALLAERGDVASIPVDFKRYVGAQIGIHNLKGQRVGKVSHLRNREHLFLVGDGATDIVNSIDVAGVMAAR